MADQEKKTVKSSRAKKSEEVGAKDTVKKSTRKASGEVSRAATAKSGATGGEKKSSTTVKKASTTRKKTEASAKSDDVISVTEPKTASKSEPKKVTSRAKKVDSVSAIEPVKKARTTRKTTSVDDGTDQGATEKKPKASTRTRKSTVLATNNTEKVEPVVAEVKPKRGTTKKKAVVSKEEITSVVEKSVKEDKLSAVKEKTVGEEKSTSKMEAVSVSSVLEPSNPKIKEASFSVKEDTVHSEELQALLPTRARKKGIPVFRTSEVAILVLITCVISLLLGGLVAYRFVGKSDNRTEVADSELQNFIQNYNYLVENYYGEVDKKELLNAAFKAMVNSLDDTYSGVIDDSQSNSFDISLKGSYTGLGVEVVNDSTGNIVIYNIFEDSPAGRSDLKVGDVLLRVNDHDVQGASTSDFVKIVQEDEDNQQFVLLVRRGDEEKSIAIKKEFITLPSVVSKTFERDGKKIGYLGVSIFAANTATQFHDELRKLENSGMDGLVIDLRGNSGGHLFAVENMISEFLDSTHVIYQEEVKDQKNKVYSSGTKTKEYPISILINGSSASASEVMTAALMEEYGAVVIGTTSYGKGTVQELRELSNGDEYKFTTKKWLTPKGEWIHTKGIAPTIEVVLNGAYYSDPSDETDNQLQEAISAVLK